MIPMTKVTPVTSVFHKMDWNRGEDDQLFHRIQRAAKKRERVEAVHLDRLCEEAAMSSIAHSVNNDLGEIIYWYDA